MKVSQNDSAVFDVIGFNMHEYEPILRPGDVKEVDIAYVLEENNWNGRRTIQMRLKDVHLLEKEEN
jgi:single-stranded-DNA-specific exonuclease